MNRHIAMLVACLLLGFGSTLAQAQQVTVGNSFNRASDSFFENIGVGWGVNFGNGAFFRFPGGGAAPPVGNPQGEARFGFGIGGNGFNANFNITAGQGSQRGLVSQSPSVTITNGGTGIFSDTAQHPFVIGVVPVVGDFPGVRFPQMRNLGISPLDERLGRLRASGAKLGSPPAAESTSAEVPPDDLPAEGGPLQLVPADDTAGKLLSVAEIRRQQQAADTAAVDQQTDEILALAARARRAVRHSRPGAAKIYYRMALRRASGDLKAELAEELAALEANR